MTVQKSDYLRGSSASVLSRSSSVSESINVDDEDVISDFSTEGSTSSYLPDKDMNRLSINYTIADSLINIRDELELEIFLAKPDIIIITEPFPKTVSSTAIDNSELKIEGYEIIKEIVVEKSRGVCIYYNTNLSVQECKVLNDYSFEESCWCTLLLSTNEKLLLGAVYRSPSNTENNPKTIVNLINSAMSIKCDYTLIVGDFNYPSISWEDWITPHDVNYSEFLFLECLSDNFLHQIIDKPSRFRHGQAANILDLILVDKLEIIVSVDQRSNLGASDHISMLININCKPVVHSVESTKRHYYKGDYQAIRRGLSMVNWELLEELNVEDSYAYFMQNIENK